MKNDDEEHEIELQEQKGIIKDNKKHVNAKEGDSFLTVLFGALIVILILFDIILHTGHSKCTSIELDLQPSDTTSSITSFKKQASFQRQNLVMVKPGKVGGSTLSGVIRHIAAHHGLSGYDNEEWIKGEPGIFSKHSKMRTLYDNIKSLKQKTFLLTIIRDPSERCLSDFNYFKTHGNHEGAYNRDYEDKLKYFEQYCTNVMLEYIAPQEKNEVLSIDESAVDEVVEMYDLIGLTERFNETMVLMKHLLGLQWRDILYIPTKVSGSSDKIQSYKSYEDETLELHEYVERKWKKTNKDFYLHGKVEFEFERKIAMIPSFEEDLIKYEMLLDTIQRACWWVMDLNPSIGKGYIKDAQRGYKCLNQVGDVDQFFDKIQLPD